MIREALSRCAEAAIDQADLADEARRLVPTLTADGGETFVTVAWHYGAPPSAGKPRAVWFPFLEARAPFARQSGVAIRPVDAGDYGLILESDEPVGTLADLADKSVRDLLAAQDRLLDLYDLFAREEALTRQPPFAPGLAAAAGELRQVLLFLYEHAFEPYYAVAHAQLRAFLARAA